MLIFYVRAGRLSSCRLFVFPHGTSDHYVVITLSLWNARGLTLITSLDTFTVTQVKWAEVKQSSSVTLLDRGIASYIFKCCITVSVALSDDVAYTMDKLSVVYLSIVGCFWPLITRHPQLRRPTTGWSDLGVCPVVSCLSLQPDPVTGPLSGVGQFFYCLFCGPAPPFLPTPITIGYVQKVVARNFESSLSMS